MKAKTLSDFLKLTLGRFLGKSLAGKRIEDIFNFLKVSESLATSGQPTEEQFVAIANAGYQTVINLALPESANALPNEKEIVESLGMEYVHIPVVWENPRRENLTDFFHTMEAHAGNPVFVHCAANMRVSAFVYLYRRICCNVSEEDARKDLLKIWSPTGVWQTFVDEMLEDYSRGQERNIH